LRDKIPGIALFRSQPDTYGCGRSILCGLFAAALLFFPLALNGQNPFSLQQCIEYAVNHNTKLASSKSSEEVAGYNLTQQKNAYIPSLSVSNQNNISTGRVLDPTTYQFLTNRTVFDMSASIGGSMTLFSGFDRPQSVEKAKLNLQYALLDTEKTKNDIALNVTALFLNIVLDKEAIEVCESKIAMLEFQEDVIRKKVEYRAATPGDFLNIQADITNARVELSTGQNNLNLDKVAMCEILEIDDWESFDITIEDQNYETIVPRLWSASDVVSSSFQLPQIKKSEIAIEMAKRDISIASSSFWPILKLNAGYGSTFSNARMRTDGTDYHFGDQLRDNMSSYVTLSFSVPILSAISVSNSVKQKKLAYAKAEYELTQTKLALDKEVKQAIVNANNSYEKYNLLEVEEQKCFEALRQTEEKYNAGAATYYDYQIAVSKLFQAQTQRLQSKYEYIFRTKIIDFYSGIPLE